MESNINGFPTEQLQWLLKCCECEGFNWLNWIEQGPFSLKKTACTSLSYVKDRNKSRDCLKPIKYLNSKEEHRTVTLTLKF